MQQNATETLRFVLATSTHYVSNMQNVNNKFLLITLSDDDTVIKNCFHHEINSFYEFFTLLLE